VCEDATYDLPPQRKGRGEGGTKKRKSCYAFSSLMESKKEEGAEREGKRGKVRLYSVYQRGKKEKGLNGASCLTPVEKEGGGGEG